jgi:4-alpha-glucanotransferase
MTAPPFSPRRLAGLLVPLFSMPSSQSWGIGEIADLPLAAAWLARAGQSFVQLLPINEMAPGQQSPYSAISAMAIDPILISLRDVEDFQPLKHTVLRAAFARFRAAEWERETTRAHALAEFIREEAWWLDDFALFRAVHAREGERAWVTWDPALRAHEQPAVDEARRELTGEVLFFQYLQWLAASQWRAARKQAGPVSVFGDLPFMVDVDSADVWANQRVFDLDGSVGAPPDAFSETGQNWGLPVYRWEEMARTGWEWLRRRARRAAALYDAYRVDHLVGFYRTYVFPRDRRGRPHFTPSEPNEQLALGERVLGILADAGAHIVAEDLGTVPDFVRASLARLGVPGHRVLRWEREWAEQGQPFREPRSYPARSVATSGTHDTEPMAIWWNRAPAAERAEVGRLPFLHGRLGPGFDFQHAAYTPALRDALIEMLFASGSDLLILPFQDVFGWSDRVNVPAVISAENWTFRLPWLVDTLDDQPEARERAVALAHWARTYGRSRD